MSASDGGRQQLHHRGPRGGDAHNPAVVSAAAAAANSSGGGGGGGGASCGGSNNSNDTIAATGVRAAAAAAAAVNNKNKNHNSAVAAAITANTTKAEAAVVVATANMQRCAEMQYCQEQLKHWRHEWQRLKAAHKQAALTASLTTRFANNNSTTGDAGGGGAWMQLPKRDKWKKSTVLTLLRMNRLQHYAAAAVKHSSSDAEELEEEESALPGPLTEGCFAEAAPASLVSDKEVFLARMSTRQSRRFYSILPPKCFTSSNNSSSSNNVQQRRRPVRDAQPLHIPEALRGDRQVLMCVLELHPSVLLLGGSSTGFGEDFADASCSFPDTLWDDPELFCAFCTGVRHVCLEAATIGMPVAAVVVTFKEAICRFSPRLRNDAALVSQLIEPLRNNINNNSKNAPSSLLFEFCELFLKTCFVNIVGNNSNNNGLEGATILRNSKTFCLHVVDVADSLPPTALKAFSKRLVNDDDLVLAVVKKNGMCLQHASYSKRRHMPTCMAACDSKPRALVYCLPGSAARSRLQRDRDRVLACFRQVQEEEAGSSVWATPEFLPPTKTGERRLYKELKPALRKDLDICLAALLSACIAVSDLPESVRRNRVFWKSAIAIHGMAWVRLPEALEDDVELAQAIEQFSCEHMAFALFARFPELFYDRDVWMKIVSSKSFFGSSEFLVETAPAFILTDKEIVLQAVRQDHEILGLLDSPLTEDRDVIEAALRCAPEALYHMNDSVQAMYPDLVADAIRSFDTDDVWELFDCIDEELWSDRRVAHAWLSQGGDYLHEEFPEEFKNDKEAFLLIAEHNPADFWCASEELCNDKQFFLQVVEKNVTLLRESSSQLAQDFDLALVAFGGCSTKSRDLAGLYDINDQDEFKFLTEFAVKVRDKVLSHENFVRRILCGISAKQVSNDCHLPLLDQGKETSLVYKKLLAEFLGVPTGSELRLLRRASINLARWGY